MNLTVGATLQNHKYAVRKQLQQSDFGVTYQAQHSVLGRPVVLQTLNGSLRQRQDFAQLRQQFLNRVRAISQQPVGNLHVLDCFEEDGLPFVVFELAPGQALPQFSDWIPVVPPASSPVALEPEVLTAPEALVIEPMPAAPIQQAEKAQKAALEPTQAAPTASPPNQTLSSTVRLTPATVPASGRAGDPRFLPSPLPNPPLSPLLGSKSFASAAAPRRAWLPMALIFLSMLGGLLGVGLGFSWRFAATQTPRSASNGDSPDAASNSSENLAPRLFSREQSFPSSADWPVSETPQLFTPAPASIEAPYQSGAELDLPPYPSLPAEAAPDLSPNPLPVEPSPQTTATPDPDPTPLAPILPQPPAMGSVANPDPIQIAPPVEAAPEPLPPAAPELPLPPPAAAEPPPPRPPKVFQN